MSSAGNLYRDPSNRGEAVIFGRQLPTPFEMVRINKADKEAAQAKMLAQHNANATYLNKLGELNFTNVGIKFDESVNKGLQMAIDNGTAITARANAENRPLTAEESGEIMKNTAKIKTLHNQYKSAIATQSDLLSKLSPFYSREAVSRKFAEINDRMVEDPEFGASVNSEYFAKVLKEDNDLLDSEAVITAFVEDLGTLKSGDTKRTGGQTLTSTYEYQPFVETQVIDGKQVPVLTPDGKYTVRVDDNLILKTKAHDETNRIVENYVKKNNVSYKEALIQVLEPKINVIQQEAAKNDFVANNYNVKPDISGGMGFVNNMRITTGIGTSGDVKNWVGHADDKPIGGTTIDMPLGVAFDKVRTTIGTDADVKLTGLTTNPINGNMVIKYEKEGVAGTQPKVKTYEVPVGNEEKELINIMSLFKTTGAYSNEISNMFKDKLTEFHEQQQANKANPTYLYKDNKKMDEMKSTLMNVTNLSEVNDIIEQFGGLTAVDFKTGLRFGWFDETSRVIDIQTKEGRPLGRFDLRNTQDVDNLKNLLFKHDTNNLLKKKKNSETSTTKPISISDLNEMDNVVKGQNKVILSDKDRADMDRILNEK